MARDYFDGDAEKINQRMRTLKDIISEHEIDDTACPLLSTQLNEMIVFCKKLQADAVKLKNYLDK